MCCGRTYLSAGLVDQARAEMSRTAAAMAAAMKAGKIIVGLEPSCTLMFRDEAVNLLPDWDEGQGAQVLTFAEYMLTVDVPTAQGRALVHGHCHQKAMGVGGTTEAVLNRTGMEASMIDSSCCGMAGPFGYQAETEEVSRAMAELSLAPAVREAPEDTLVVADGFSCRCQIKDVTGRGAVSLARALDGMAR